MEDLSFINSSMCLAFFPYPIIDRNKDNAVLSVKSTGNL